MDFYRGMLFEMGGKCIELLKSQFTYITHTCCSMFMVKPARMFLCLSFLPARCRYQELEKKASEEETRAHT